MRRCPIFRAFDVEVVFWLLSVEKYMIVAVFNIEMCEYEPSPRDLSDAHSSDVKTSVLCGRLF